MGGDRVMPSGYRYEWTLFTDWCAAVQVPSLPASPLTVAEFLHENPAGVDALRRRVSAINRAHRDASEPAPGTVTAVRLQLDNARAERIARRHDRVAPTIARLPITGWPTGLFGRRDAVILALHAAGLRPVDISRLDRRDIETVGSALWIGGRHQLSLSSPAGESSLISFTTVWTRWEQVLRIVDRHPSTRILEQYLRGVGLPADEATAGAGSGPAVPPIDRWGALPLPLTAMTAPAVTSIITAHLNGTPPPHASLPARRPPRQDFDTTETSSPNLDTVAVSQLDGGYYKRGTAARRAAHTALSDLSDIFDDVDERADQLLRRTLNLLEQL